MSNSFTFLTITDLFMYEKQRNLIWNQDQMGLKIFHSAIHKLVSGIVGGTKNTRLAKQRKIRWLG